jgi:hypothetical protein
MERSRAAVGRSTPPSDAPSPRRAGSVADHGRGARRRTRGDRSPSGPRRNRPPRSGRRDSARRCASVGTEAGVGAACISRQSPDRRRSPISAVRYESAARLSFAITRSSSSGGSAPWDVALFLPFRSNKERQTAARRDTKRRSKIARFYERWRTMRATSSTRPQRTANVSFSAC